MCRLAAYLGPYIRFDEFLLEPTHNLARQALLSETTPAAYPDGFGLGWYAADGVPSVYLHSLPLWSDLNLPHLAHSIYARLMLAIVQGAAAPFSSPTHSQPCHDNRLLFLHQGFVEDFNRLRHTLRDFLEPPIEMAMVGNTPAEHSVRAAAPPAQRRSGTDHRAGPGRPVRSAGGLAGRPAPSA